MSDQPILSMRGVTRTHGEGATQVRAMVDVDLDVAAGELVAVMGPSGSGKSTLLHVAGGLDQPSSGSIAVEGQELGSLSRAELAALRRGSVGYVFQELNLIPTLTAAENVSLPLELGGSGQAAARDAAIEALAGVGLDGLAEQFPDTLSGGQRQRVAIARALVGPRRLLLADEPTGALDTRSGEDVLRVLRDRVDAGAAGVLVTHDSRHAAWADRIVFLRDGRVVDSGAGAR